MYTPEEAVVVKAAEQLMADTMAKYDPSHDAYHVERVRRTALRIAHQVSIETPSVHPDLFVVELAALLHDVLDKKYVSAALASDPYAFFVPFFQVCAAEGGVDLIADGRAQVIAKIVDNVSWSTEKRLRVTGMVTPWHKECVELHCVQDADRLDAIGAFGIMRCSAYSTVSNRPLHTPAEDPAQDSSAIQHFHHKLLHIKDRLKTAPGKRMGEKRHQFMVNFLNEVNGEFNGEDLA
ncbi:hypothetical protein EUX98_g6318 [Antrodiella citrinella]|uniref:HD/PDEase domain-containing protein n=1 Tax=Antrodiella citrinella TaxID=2447956 RepID=A0A4S4MPJ4_9APHY|nr:hypothetical protein EUX98_g6318 [Antrodiella citrinella]